MEKEPPIAVKTHTYLDILRERKKAPKVTKSSTTTVTTTTSTKREHIRTMAPRLYFVVISIAIVVLSLDGAFDLNSNAQCGFREVLLRVHARRML